MPPRLALISALGKARWPRSVRECLSRRLVTFLGVALRAAFMAVTSTSAKMALTNDVCNARAMRISPGLNAVSRGDDTCFALLCLLVGGELDPGLRELFAMRRRLGLASGEVRISGPAQAHAVSFLQRTLVSRAVSMDAGFGDKDVVRRAHGEIHYPSRFAVRRPSPFVNAPFVNPTR